MLKFLGKIVAGQNSKQFEEQLRRVKIFLYAELSMEYQRDFDSELASILASQVANYLTGEDLDQSYASVDEPTRSKIRQIKDQIISRADEKMLNDDTLRETIVYTHRMKTVLSFAKKGPQYLKSAEKHRSEQILLRYGAQFPQEVTPKIYDQLFSRFAQAKQRFISGARH
ncbi:MAG TPA: hypothetical protein VN956_04370 [Pyrinomonadaceae bacterium]|nr:hypothetical protein [Pyrinomonadaceae bacterium]